MKRRGDFCINEKGILMILMVVLLSVSFLNFVMAEQDDNVIIDPLDNKVIMTIRIIDFESPIKLGDFLKFTYYLRDVSGIGDTLNLDFWIEKDGFEISSGSDVVYISDTSNRTITTKIFLPSTLKSGVYQLGVRVTYKGNVVESYRTIEINIMNGVAVINSAGGWNLNIYIILVLILLAFSNIFLIYFLEKKGFAKKNKLLILTVSSFIIIGALVYFLSLISFLPQAVIYIYFILLGALVLLILGKMFLKEDKHQKILNKK